VRVWLLPLSACFVFALTNPSPGTLSFHAEMAPSADRNSMNTPMAMRPLGRVWPASTVAWLLRAHEPTPINTHAKIWTAQ